MDKITPLPTSKLAEWLRAAQSWGQDLQKPGSGAGWAGEGLGALLDSVIGEAPEAFDDAAAGMLRYRRPSAQESIVGANKPAIDAALLGADAGVGKAAFLPVRGLMKKASKLEPGKSVAEAVGKQSEFETVLRELRILGELLPGRKEQGYSLMPEVLDDQDPADLLRFYDQDVLDPTPAMAAARSGKSSIPWSKVEPDQSLTRRALQHARGDDPTLKLEDFQTPTVRGTFNQDAFGGKIAVGKSFASDPGTKANDVLHTLAHERQHLVQDTFLDDRRMEGRMGTSRSNYMLAPQTRAPDDKKYLDWQNVINDQLTTDEFGARQFAAMTQEEYDLIELDETLKSLEKLNPAGGRSRAAYELYLRNPGEAEARAAQSLAIMPFDDPKPKLDQDWALKQEAKIARHHPGMWEIQKKRYDAIEEARQLLQAGQIK